MNKELDLKEFVKKFLKLSNEEQKIVSAFVEGIQYASSIKKQKGA